MTLWDRFVISVEYGPEVPKEQKLHLMSKAPVTFREGHG